MVIRRRILSKFKEINGETYKLQPPKDATVKDAKDKICELNDISIEDFSIFMGNQRLADFNVLSELQIPNTVLYFSVGIIDLETSVTVFRDIHL